MTNFFKTIKTQFEAGKEQMEKKMESKKKKHGTEAVVEALEAVKAAEAKEAKETKETKESKKDVKAPKYSTMIKELDATLASTDRLFDLFGKAMEATEDEAEQKFYAEERFYCNERRGQLEELKNKFLVKQGVQELEKYLEKKVGDALSKSIMDKLEENVEDDLGKAILDQFKKNVADKKEVKKAEAK